jgi:hypothetical protein
MNHPDHPVELLRDRDPQDPGVDITGIMKIAGGAWNQLK